MVFPPSTMNHLSDALFNVAGNKFSFCAYERNHNYDTKYQIQRGKYQDLHLSTHEKWEGMKDEYCSLVLLP